MLLSSRCGLSSVISLQDLHQVAIRARVVVGPRRLAAEAAEAAASAAQLVAQPHEGEAPVVLDAGLVVVDRGGAPPVALAGEGRALGGHGDRADGRDDDHGDGPPARG